MQKQLNPSRAQARLLPSLQKNELRLDAQAAATCLAVVVRVGDVDVVGIADKAYGLVNDICLLVELEAGAHLLQCALEFVEAVVDTKATGAGVGVVAGLFVGVAHALATRLGPLARGGGGQFEGRDGAGIGGVEGVGRGGVGVVGDVSVDESGGRGSAFDDERVVLKLLEEGDGAAEVVGRGVVVFAATGAGGSAAP